MAEAQSKPKIKTTQLLLNTRVMSTRGAQGKIEKSSQKRNRSNFEGSVADDVSNSVLMTDINNSDDERPQKRHRVTTLVDSPHQSHPQPNQGDTHQSLPIGSQEDEDLIADPAALASQYKNLKRAYLRLKNKIHNVKSAISSTSTNNNSVPVSPDQIVREMQIPLQQIVSSTLLESIERLKNPTSNHEEKINQLKLQIKKLEEDNGLLRHENITQKESSALLMSRLKSEASLLREQTLIEEQGLVKIEEEKRFWLTTEKNDLVQELMTIRNEAAALQQENERLSQSKADVTQQLQTLNTEKEAIDKLAKALQQENTLLLTSRQSSHPSKDDQSLESLRAELLKSQDEKRELTKKKKSYEQALKVLYVQLKKDKSQQLDMGNTQNV